MDNVLCSADSASMKYYFNEEQYGILPKAVKDELRICLVSYCADVGGIIILAFGSDYTLSISTIDPIDEIGSELLIKRMRRDKAELFEKLEEFARAYAELTEKARAN